MNLKFGIRFNSDSGPITEILKLAKVAEQSGFDYIWYCEDLFKRDAWIKETFKDYHAYTYSFYGYKKILEEAGFNKVELYWTLNYNKPKFAGRFDGESFSHFLKLLEKDRIRLTLLNYLYSIAESSESSHFIFSGPDYGSRTM